MFINTRNIHANTGMFKLFWYSYIYINQFCASMVSQIVYISRNTWQCINNKYILSLMLDVLTSMFVHTYCDFLLAMSIILTANHKCFWFMVYAHVSSLEGRELCTRLHIHTHTHTHSHSHTMLQNMHTCILTILLHYHLAGNLSVDKLSKCHNVHSIRYAYMVQNSGDIVYSVNKYCQVEYKCMYVCYAN